MSHRLLRMDNLSDSADAAAAGADVTAFLLFLFFLFFKKKNLINFCFRLICKLHSQEMVTEDGGLKYGNCKTQLLVWAGHSMCCK